MPRNMFARAWQAPSNAFQLPTTPSAGISRARHTFQTCHKPKQIFHRTGLGIRVSCDSCRKAPKDKMGTIFLAGSVVTG